MEKANVKKQSNTLLMDIDRKDLPDAFPNHISISELRKIWTDKHDTYTDNELYRIREWLYNMANITLNIIAQNSKQNLRYISKSDKIKKAADVELSGKAA